MFVKNSGLIYYCILGFSNYCTCNDSVEDITPNKTTEVSSSMNWRCHHPMSLDINGIHLAYRFNLVSKISESVFPSCFLAEYFPLCLWLIFICYVVIRTFQLFTVFILITDSWVLSLCVAVNIYSIVYRDWVTVEIHRPTPMQFSYSTFHLFTLIRTIYFLSSRCTSLNDL